METSPKHLSNPQSLIPSPNSHSTTTSSNSSTTTTTPTTPTNGIHSTQTLPLPKPITRSESANPYPTTFVQADTSSFKQVVQMLTGSPRPTNTSSLTQPDPSSKPHNTHNIPPIKSIPKKNQSSGFKLYERRNSLKNLKLNPLNPIFAPTNSGFVPRKPEILSPSILDFPALVLSPVTPLIPDPFERSGAVNYATTNCFSPMSYSKGNLLDSDAEAKAIKEKGFYMHPSPSTTPRDAEPRLLPLFPVTSPRVSGSANPSP